MNESLLAEPFEPARSKCVVSESIFSLGFNTFFSFPPTILVFSTACSPGCFASLHCLQAAARGKVWLEFLSKLKAVDCNC